MNPSQSLSPCIKGHGKVAQKITRSHRLAPAAVLLAAMLAASSAYAADQTYSDTHVSNVWDTSTLNWDSSTAAWTNDNNAIFGGTGESVAVSSGVTVGNMTFNSTGYTLTGTLGLTASGASTVSVGSGLTTTISAAISGTGASLTKSGAGTLILSGANTYSGGVTLSAGTLSLGASSTPTSGTVTSGPLGTGTLTLSGGTLNFFGGAFTVANAITATASTTTNVQVASAQNDVLNGNLTGSGNLNHTANGTTGQLQWGGDNSGYTGTYTQNSGNTSLAFNSASAGSAGATWVFNNPTNQRTRLNFGTGTISFGSMSGNGSIANVAGSGMATVSVGALNTNTTFSGILGGSSAGQGQNIALTKVGSGTLTLSGANTFTGGTTLSAGTLQLGSATTLSSSTGTITVNGGTLSSSVASTTLGGHLTLSGGSLTANGTSAGTIVLAANKNFSMTTGTFTYSLNDTVTGSGTGTFGITGGTFDLTNSITDYGLTYSVFSGFSSGTVSGLSFANYDSANYVASLATNGQLTFSAVPEPSTYAAILGSLVLGAVALNRRRHTLGGS